MERVATAIDEPVFLTSGASTVSGFTTIILFMRTGRDEARGLTAAGSAVGGKFVGLLDDVLTTLSRICADASPVKHTAATTRHTERNILFFTAIKLKTPIILCRRKPWEMVVNCSPI